MTTALDAAYQSAAQAIGCDLAAIRAVFDVEASGKFLDSSGEPVCRFEPHHFPRWHWPSLGFDPIGQEPWRASLAISTSKRRAMYETSLRIDVEAADRASSHGAPQIMGFNCVAAGYQSATAMRRAFADPVKQIEAFARLICAWGLDGAVRAHDWLTFAGRYNGSGQAAEYARRMESAYRKRSGQASAVVLRVGATGESVVALQQRLVAGGYLDASQVDAAFGPATEQAVRAVQEANGLAVDGIVGARTWAALPALHHAAQPQKQPTQGAAVAGKVGDVGARAGGGAIGAKALQVALSPAEAETWGAIFGVPSGVAIAAAFVVAGAVFFGPELIGALRRKRT